jgi:hypothetical protein
MKGTGGRKTKTVYSTAQYHWCDQSHSFSSSGRTALLILSINRLHVSISIPKIGLYGITSYWVRFSADIGHLLQRRRGRCLQRSQSSSLTLLERAREHLAALSFSYLLCH